MIKSIQTKDPVNAELRKNKTEQRRLLKIKAMEEEENIARGKLEERISTRWQEHILAFQDQVKKLQKGMSDKHAKKLKELDHVKNMEYARAKEYVEEREAFVKGQFDKEVYNVKRKYQQHIGNRNTEQMKALEIRDIENRWTKQGSKLRDTIRQKNLLTERKFKADAENLIKHKRRDEAELDICLRKINARYYEQQDQHRTFYIERHESKFKEKRELIMKEEALYLSQTKDIDIISQESKSDNLDEDLQSERKGDTTKRSHENITSALASKFRQNLRKSILTKASPSVQLAVDIHNEGIVVIHRNTADKSTERTKSDFLPKSTDKTRSEFMPWSSTSRNYLYDIICGVIPRVTGLLDIGSFKNSGLQGGQLKCLVTDLRVSDEFAIKQRSTAFRQIKELNSKGSFLSLQAKLAALEETMIKRAEIEALCKKSTKKAAQEGEREVQKLKVNYKGKCSS